MSESVKRRLNNVVNMQQDETFERRGKTVKVCHGFKWEDVTQKSLVVVEAV